MPRQARHAKLAEGSEETPEHPQPSESSESGETAENPRVSVRLPARISTIDPETDPFTGKAFFRTCEETSANLSGGGVFVSMREAIPPGRRVLVELEMPGGRSVQTVGRVAWTRVAPDETSAEAPAGTSTGSPEPGVGVQFLGGAGDDLETLERFVTRSIRSRAVAPRPTHDVASGS